MDNQTLRSKIIEKFENVIKEYDNELNDSIKEVYTLVENDACYLSSKKRNLPFEKVYRKFANRSTKHPIPDYTKFVALVEETRKLIKSRNSIEESIKQVSEKNNISSEDLNFIFERTNKS